MGAGSVDASSGGRAATATGGLPARRLPLRPAWRARAGGGLATWCMAATAMLPLQLRGALARPVAGTARCGAALAATATGNFERESLTSSRHTHTHTTPGRKFSHQLQEIAIPAPLPPVSTCMISVAVRAGRSNARCHTLPNQPHTNGCLCMSSRAHMNAHALVRGASAATAALSNCTNCP